MPFRYRFSRPGDFPAALRLLNQDRALFSKETWGMIGELLPDLIERGRLTHGLVEDSDTGRLCFFGATAWATPATIARFLGKEPGLFRESLLCAEARRDYVFLSPKQLPAANASGELALIHLFGCPDETDFTKPSGFELHRLAFEFFMTLHAGFQVAEFWQETVNPVSALHVESQGMREIRQLPLAGGPPARLFCFNRADAAEKPGAPFAYMMKYPPPRLGFTLSQQRLLQHALLDYPDTAVAEELDITVEAVRKRWRAIHARHEFGERRALLGYLRQHPEELRPWPKELSGLALAGAKHQENTAENKRDRDELGVG